MSDVQNNRPDLAKRVFAKRGFAVAWVVFLAAVFGTVGARVANAWLVCWVRGTDAYLHQGIRVVHGRPLKFSDGVPVPSGPEAVTGLVIFLVVFFGLSFLLQFVLRLYDRHCRKPNTNAA